jgi:hypothetical protein
MERQKKASERAEKCFIKKVFGSKIGNSIRRGMLRNGKQMG